MKQITLLDQDTIDQIAAGEVVERPASVVKELTENAVDAGSTHITIEVREGGTTFIRITDNGEGIAKDQIRTAFARHATSKITSAADLPTVTTLGFRGEALSSISAVSQMELITKTPGSLIGTRYLIEGGQETAFEEIGAPEGSTFLVKNLFYNTPVRKKFLKSPSTEGAYISDLAEHLALSHPEISFKLIMNGQVKLHTSGNGNLKDVIYGIYGREIATNLLSVDYQTEDIRISGFIGKPVISRGNRNYENYFVGERFIKDKTITKAIEDGYRTFMMQHRYPFTALYLHVEGDRVDVNVHPAKREVRFSDNEAIYQAVYQAVKTALTHKDLIRAVSLGDERKEQKMDQEKRKERLSEAAQKPEPFEALRRQHLATTDSPYQPKYSRTYAFDPASFVKEPASSYHAESDGAPKPLLKGRFGNDEAAASEKAVPEQSVTANAVDTEPAEAEPAASPSCEAVPEERASDYSAAVLNAAAAENNAAPSDEPTAVSESSISHEDTPAGQMNLFAPGFLSQEGIRQHRLIGQLFNTYWLVEFDRKLYIIDQHAAHEKVQYEKLLKQFREKTFTSQMISPSILITLNAAEQLRLEEYAELFHSIGFVVEPFGGKDYAISAVPDNLYGFTDGSLFIDILDSLTSDDGEHAREQLLDKLATMACKSAVKGGMKMTGAEADHLIEQLLALENPYNCPHGRPTIISMSQYELEKKFKRIV